MLFERVFGAGFELVEVPAGLGDADDGDVEGSALDHRLQRGKDFFVGEVAGGAEEDEGVGVGGGIGGIVRFSISLSLSDYFVAGFSRWPPNS